MRLLKYIGDCAKATGYRAFLVGGTVRDIILGRDNLDLDITVEGDARPPEGVNARSGAAIKLGEALAKELDGRLIAHKMFGTCSLTLKNKLKIDFATARRETYELPAALPKVEPSSLEDDLARRDFTINAMAVSLNKEDFGQLIDFFGGRKDLAKGIIRVMHDKSFIDDPTRIFRAIRFEKRFKFAIDKHTFQLIEEAIKKGMLGKLSKYRIKKEAVKL